MPRPTVTAASGPTRFARRLVLGAAVVIGMAAALAPRAPAVRAQEPASTVAAPAAKSPAAPKTLTITDESGVRARIEVRDARDAAAKGSATPGDSPDDQAAATAGADKTGSRSRAEIVGKHGRIKIEGLGTDREFDSVGDFVHNEPAIANMVVAIVAVVFLSPVLLIGLVLWYRMRKARMLNETMLSLAERGAVSSADALEVLAGGKQASALATAGAAADTQTKQIRRRAAWSDLRKGVFTGGVGLALILYSSIEDREPNALGLVLLFVGIGFVVLWWFEERQLVPPAGAAAGPEPSGMTSGKPSGGPPPSA